MTQRISISSTELDIVINSEQFNKVVEAILAGKYSFACLLILSFAGYNPQDYIPYQTYIRLMRESCQGRNSSKSRNETTNRSDKQGDKTSFGETCERKPISQVVKLSKVE